MKAEVAQMKRQGTGGAILFTTSVLASIGDVGTSIYSASKGGLVSMARAAAVELGAVDIRVNCISPALTRTPMTNARIAAQDNGSATHPFALNIPLKRLAEADDMAQVALFLLSDRSSYIDGQALVVDGGQSAF